MGSSVQKILDENYQSIFAAKMMKEALEREDSAILLLLHGKWKEGRSILFSADSLFESEFEFASNNITVAGEQERLDTINQKYSSYKKLWERPIVNTDKQKNLDWYSIEVHKSFVSVKESLNKLINLNDKMMYQTATDMENHANKAIMPGIVAIISALIFTFIFSYLVNYYIASPIIKITERIVMFKEKRLPFEVNIETKDEIQHLSEALSHLCASLNSEETKK
jgi:methyl-accepting chemotaxis protein